MQDATAPTPTMNTLVHQPVATTQFPSLHADEIMHLRELYHDTPCSRRLTPGQHSWAVTSPTSNGIKVTDNNSSAPGSLSTTTVPSSWSSRNTTEAHANLLKNGRGKANLENNLSGHRSHDKVVLIQVTSPTSIEDREESDLVARINGSPCSLSTTPVRPFWIGRASVEAHANLLKNGRGEANLENKPSWGGKLHVNQETRRRSHLRHQNDRRGSNLRDQNAREVGSLTLTKQPVAEASFETTPCGDGLAGSSAFGLLHPNPAIVWSATWILSGCDPPAAFGPALTMAFRRTGAAILEFFEFVKYEKHETKPKMLTPSTRATIRPRTLSTSAIPSTQTRTLFGWKPRLATYDSHLDPLYPRFIRHRTLKTRAKLLKTVRRRQQFDWAAEVKPFWSPLFPQWMKAGDDQHISRQISVLERKTVCGREIVRGQNEVFEGVRGLFKGGSAHGMGKRMAAQQKFALEAIESNTEEAIQQWLETRTYSI